MMKRFRDMPIPEAREMAILLPLLALMVPTLLQKVPKDHSQTPITRMSKSPRDPTGSTMLTAREGKLRSPTTGLSIPETKTAPGVWPKDEATPKLFLTKKFQELKPKDQNWLEP